MAVGAGGVDNGEGVSAGVGGVDELELWHIFSFGGYFFFGWEHGGTGGDGIVLAGSTVEEARTACIIFWQGGRILFLAAAWRRLYGIDDEIYEWADFRSTFLVATTTTTVNFRRDLL
jgi:hypothetical protein